MKALQLIAHGSPGQFEVSDVPTPAPGAGEVLVRVRACGLNHLDLWTEEKGLPVPIQLPRIPGSEIAGEIAALGPDVSGWREGERVAVQSNLFCGKCEFCAAGEESICLNSRLLGVDLDGGFAEFVVVPASSLVRLPDGLGFTASAALSLAASTAMHMLTDRTTVKPGQWVLVMGGASGVGSAAVQIAAGLGAKVIATGSTEEKRSLAMSLGAHFTVDSRLENWPSEVRRITERRGVDIVVEHVGGKVFEQLFLCLARGGTIVTCGATTGRDVQLNLWPLFVKQQRLVGSYGRKRKDLAATLEWAEQGRIKPVIDREIPLAEAAEAFTALRNRQVLGKLIIVP